MLLFFKFIYLFISEMGSHSVVKADIELEINLWSHSPECWDSSYRLLCPALRLNTLLEFLKGVVF